MLPDRVSNPGPLTYESGAFIRKSMQLVLLSLFQGALYKQLDKQKAEIQIRGGIKHNSKIFFLSQKTKVVTPH